VRRASAKNADLFSPLDLATDVEESRRRNGLYDLAAEARATGAQLLHGPGLAAPRKGDPDDGGGR
jgi:hypothetical protein